MQPWHIPQHPTSCWRNGGGQHGAVDVKPNDGEYTNYLKTRLNSTMDFSLTRRAAAAPLREVSSTAAHCPRQSFFSTIKGCFTIEHT